MRRTDDPTVTDDNLLLRRVLDKPVEWFVEEGDSIRVSSAAFRDSLNELSVNVATETTTAEVLEGREFDGLVEFPARIPRENNHIISKTLEPDDPPEPSHRVVCPHAGLSKSQIKKTAKAMALAAVWVVLPKSERDYTAQSS